MSKCKVCLGLGKVLLPDGYVTCMSCHGSMIATDASAKEATAYKVTKDLTFGPDHKKRRWKNGKLCQ
jgi:hypothetical protein